MNHGKFRPWLVALLAVLGLVSTARGQSLQLEINPAEPRFAADSARYQQLWHDQGTAIVAALERVSGTRLTEPRIAVIVFEGVSESGRAGEPMKLRASYALRTKQATLVHELGNRYLDQLELDPRCLGDVHDLLALWLIEVWGTLWGADFVNEQAQVEMQRSARYRRAWEGALALSSAERTAAMARMQAECVSRR